MAGAHDQTVCAVCVDDSPARLGVSFGIHEDLSRFFQSKRYIFHGMILTSKSFESYEMYVQKT